jgi:DNA-binding response OmpR family regulator
MAGHAVGGLEAIASEWPARVIRAVAHVEGAPPIVIALLPGDGRWDAWLEPQDQQPALDVGSGSISLQDRLAIATVEFVPDGVLQHGALVIDRRDSRVSRAGEWVPLSPRENELLWWLATHPGRMLDRHNLLKDLWGEFYEVGTVTVHVMRLRQKLGPVYGEWVRTSQGFGYGFFVDGQHQADLVFDSCEIDLRNRVVSVHGRDCGLSDTEFRIVELLATAPERTFTRAAIVAHVGTKDSALTILVSRVNRKLGFYYVKAEHGVGYRWVRAPKAH